MRKTLLTVSALMAVAATAGAQSASAIRLRLDPGSELTIEGTSSLHAFHCKTNKTAWRRGWGTARRHAVAPLSEIGSSL